jgi:hypothetical protein
MAVSFGLEDVQETVDLGGSRDLFAQLPLQRRR